VAPVSYDLAWTWLLLRFPPMIVPAALRSAADASRLDDLAWHRGLHSCRVLIDLALWEAQEDPRAQTHPSRLMAPSATTLLAAAAG
jgi:hypothetical protein